MNYKASTINQLGFLFRFFDRPFLEKKKDYRIHAAQEMKELNYHFAGTSLHVLKKSTTDIVFLRARCFKIRCPAKCCIFYENLFQVFGNTEWQHHSILLVRVIIIFWQIGFPTSYSSAVYPNTHWTLIIIYVGGGRGRGRF